jgi:hypothetical protein
MAAVAPIVDLRFGQPPKISSLQMQSRWRHRYRVTGAAPSSAAFQERDMIIRLPHAKALVKPSKALDFQLLISGLGADHRGDDWSSDRQRSAARVSESSLHPSPQGFISLLA